MTTTQRIAACILAAGLWSVAPRAEELDLTGARTVDWAQEDHGGIAGPQALVAPTGDPVELAGLLKKLYGIRLSSEDAAHTVVLAAGAHPEGARLSVQRADIDRIRHVVELTAVLELAEGGREPAEIKPPPKAPEDEVLVIGKADPNARARPEPQKPEAPVAESRRAGGNPALFLPAGRLEPGTWWLRVKLSIRQGERLTEQPVRTDSFTVKDQRPYTQSTKGSRTPNAGLEPPDSPSVTRGMGGGP
ncbi:MAG: hypothetical protein M5U26_01035 [Planctomycetota bacterium]|nr:hypothetical protein [Planctomycetota bacterium]